LLWLPWLRPFVSGDKGKGFHSIAQGFFRIENADSHDSRIANSRERGAQRVVDDLAVRRAKVYVGQAVHVVVVEGFLQVAEVVLSAG